MADHGHVYTVLYWNVKYFGTSSDNFLEKCAALAELTSKKMADIVVFVELTSTAAESMKEIYQNLNEAGFGGYTEPKLLNADGGNNEHFGVLTSVDFGLHIKLEDSGRRLGGGTRSVGRLTFSDPNLCLYICHPSPSAFTKRVAISEAEDIVANHQGAAVMVGDFNTEDWSSGAAVTAGAATFQSTSSGSLKNLDGAVFNDGARVSVIGSERISRDSTQSDHAWILFEIKF